MINQPNRNIRHNQQLSLLRLIESAENMLSQIANHPLYLQLRREGYSSDITIGDARQAVDTLKTEVESLR